MCADIVPHLIPDPEDVGTLVTWHYTVSLGRSIDERDGIGIVVGIEEKHGRPGAWVMWGTYDKPMWSPAMMLKKIEDAI